MMSTQQRLRSEREFHDRQANARARVLQAEDLRFSDAFYLQHENWIEPAFAALGTVEGRRVLDLGCGHGMAAVVLARRGARVTACDLSPGYLREVQARARANDVLLDTVAADAEYLPFADRSFDAVWGNAILHHLDLARAAGEIQRVLRPGGRAVFCEPWGENSFLNWVRKHCPYPGKERTPDERPLLRRDLLQLRRVFSRVETRGHQLLAMAGPVLPSPHLRARLHLWDCQLLKRFTSLENYCRYVVIDLRK